ncbi:MAG: ATP-binding cassette domain-containing protein [SAR324 cluster bacterium]|nr:ATP-binding cassette domain-containing protein [SAR324 cluster bacterium]
MTSLLKIQNLTMHFPVYRGVLRRQVGVVHALDGVSFSVNPGETLGIVGESGSGKTTLGQTVLRLNNPTSGKILFEDADITHHSARELRPLRQRMQMIFQDPFDSLNSRHTIGEILEEPFIIHQQRNAVERRNQVSRLLEQVGVSQGAINRYPHEFSGGQRQRIGIARAIALNPRLIVCDEPVSALDVSIQAQILNLLLELQERLHLTYLFISHDLAVVRHVSDRVAVMYLGQFVEMTDSDTIYSGALHPYTQALISAIPSTVPTGTKQKIVLKGDVPSPINLPSGCRFHTRCPMAQELCGKQIPEWRKAGEKADHWVRCHLVDQ